MIEVNDKCDFCEGIPDFGFDYEWDANLCWLCHLSQNTAMFFTRHLWYRKLAFILN